MNALRSVMIIVFICVMLLKAEANEPSLNLTLYDAVKIALVYNPDIQMAQEAAQQSQHLLEITQAIFLPSVRVYSEYLYADAPSLYLFKKVDQRDLPYDVDFNNPGSFSNLETGVTATYNLFNGGKDIAFRKIKQFQVEEKKALGIAVKNRIASEVISLYYNCMAAKNYVSITEKSAETVTEQLRVMKVQFAGGSVLKSDILSLKVRLAEAQEDVVKSRNNHKTLMIMLNTILGHGMDKRFVLTGQDYGRVDSLTDEDDGIRTALSKRPELLSVQAKIQQAELAIKTASQGYLPKVDFNTAIYTDADGEHISDSGDDWNWMMGVRLNWDIFTGLTTRKEYDAALSALAQARHLERKIRSNIEKDVKISYMKLKESEERYRVTEKSVAMAEEALFLIKKRYEGGSETIAAYLETELARSRAAMNSISAYYDKKKALAGIARSTAVLLDDFKETRTSENETQGDIK